MVGRCSRAGVTARLSPRVGVVVNAGHFLLATFWASVNAKRGFHISLAVKARDNSVEGSGSVSHGDVLEIVV